MYTAASLQAQTVKDLGKLASQFGVEGWRSMRKDELVRALVRAAKRKSAATASSRSARSTAKSAPKKKPKAKSAASRSTSPAAGRSTKANTKKRTSGKTTSGKTTTPKKSSRSTAATTRKPAAAKRNTPTTKAKTKAPNPNARRRIKKANEERARTKNLATPVASTPANGKHRRNSGPRSNASIGKDRVVLLVRDAYWLQAWWELTRQSIERAKAAMAEQWHTAKPVLRLVQVELGGSTSSAERVVRDIPIHGGVKMWYIDVKDSPRSYRVDIGYLASNDRFFTLARSNSVTTPRPSAGDLVEDDWSDIADNCEKIYALSGGYTDEAKPAEIQELFEERLGRPMGSPVGARYGVGADRMLNRRKEFEFEVDAEMIIYGTTRPNAHVTLAGTPLKIRPDGSFSARLSMPDRRQVLPIVAASPDGVERRTVVLAVERNTKVMEPQIREAND